jgi:hypothetical protein
MRIKLVGLISALAIVVGALVSLSLKALAQTEGERVTFLVPVGTEISGFATVIVAGPSKGTARAELCTGRSDDFPVHQIVVINPPRGSDTVVVRVDAVVIRNEPLEPGTRLVDLQSLTFSCGNGALYDKWIGTVTTRDQSPDDASEPAKSNAEVQQTTCGCAQANSQVIAQEEGDTVVIAVPADSPISETAKKLIYVGRPGPSVDARNCASDGNLRVMQTIIVVDPAGDSSRRIEGIVTLTKNGAPVETAVPNGTVLDNLRAESDCTVQGVPYFRYTATVLKGEPQ